MRTEREHTFSDAGSAGDPPPSPALRVLPLADGLDPSDAPLGAVWFRRQTHLVSDDQYRITVPCVLGEPVQPGVHAALTAELHRRWIDAAGVRRWGITSVVAAFGGPRSRRAQLTLAITASTPQGLNDPHLGRDLSRALARALPAAHV